MAFKPLIKAQDVIHNKHIKNSINALNKLEIYLRGDRTSADIIKERIRRFILSNFTKIFYGNIKTAYLSINDSGFIWKTAVPIYIRRNLDFDKI